MADDLWYLKNVPGSKRLNAIADKLDQNRNQSNRNQSTTSTQTAQAGATSAAQKRWWKTQFPFAGSLNAAQHIDYFLTNPENFVNDVLSVYDDLPDSDKPIYADDIKRYMEQLNSHDTTLLHDKIGLVPTGTLGQFTVKIWPAIGDFFWLKWANEDINGFLTEHLKNLANIPVDQRKPHVNYFRDWIRRTNTTGLINSAREDLREKYIQVTSRDFSPGTQAAAFGEGGGKGLLIGGILIGGGLWLFSQATSKKKVRRRK